MDFLDWDPSMSVDDQPDWAQSIGFALDHESAKSEDFSNWLDDTVGQPFETLEVENEDEIEPPLTEESQEVVANLDESQDEMSEIAFPTDGKGEDNEIPDWIKDAGWEVSKEEDEKLDKSFMIPSIIPLDDEISSRKVEKLSEDRIDEIKDEEEEIQPAEIPGWLQEIAPAEDSINIPEEDDEFEVKNLEELFDNLEKDKSEFIRSESELSWEKEFTEDKESSLDDSLQGFDFSSLSLNEEESKTSFKSEEEFATEEKFEDDLDWIKDLSIDDESVGSDNFQGTTSIENDLEIEEEEEINKHSLDQIINELEEIEITDKDTTSAMDEDWLNSLVLDEIKEDTEKEFFEESEKAGIPDWIKSVIDEESEQSSITSDNIVDSLPDWLSISDENIEDKFDNIKISFDEVKDRSIPVDKIIDFEELVENNEDKSIEESLSVSIEDEFLSSPEELKSEQLDNQIDPSSLEIEKIEETIAEFQPITDSQEVMDSEIQEQKTEEFILDIETLSQDVEIPEELIEEIQSNADSEEEIVSQTEELTTEEFSLDLESPSMEVEKPEELIEEIQPITDSEDEMVSQFEEQIIEEFSLDLESPSLEEEKVEELIEEDQLTIQDEENELESALAWMEGLASKQGAEEDTLLSTPEERSETPPEWVSEELKLTQDVDEELDTTPSWLKELEIETDEVLSQETTETLEEISSTEFLDLVEGKTDEITREVVQDIDKVHDFENLFEELENEIDEEKADFPVQEVETKDEETESQELIADPSIEEEISFEKGEELSNAFLEDVVIPEEISEIDLSDAEDQKFEVIEDLSSEDQLIESVEDVQESLTLEQEPVTQIKEEIEDTHPVKVKDDRFDELEAARKFLDSGNVEESIKLFDKLIQDDFDLDSIIENIQNALDHHYPIDINLWQALGDAYVKNNQFQNALDAYSKAEDLLL
ncbi:MAG: hypothetical protein IH585_18865 [Anaerolineaceae bacterium]|nr:hypothetical protein [Anaerolineaceae bacterium]